MTCQRCYPIQAAREGSIRLCREHRLEAALLAVRTPFASTLTPEQASERLREINRLTYEALES